MVKKLPIFLVLACLLTVNAIAAVPNEMEHEEQDGYKFIIKTFELAPGEDARELEEEPFELMGYKYSLFSMTKSEKTFDDSRACSETITVETSSNEMQIVLDALAPSIEYNRDGYTGTLTLDHTTIKTVASGFSTRSYGLTETKTYSGLDRNDPSYIQKKTAEKNGVTLPLTNIEWSVQAMDEDLNPTMYTAVAYYSGSYSASVANGYVTTAIYKGEIGTSGISSVIYTLTYIGEEVKAATDSPQLDALALGTGDYQQLDNVPYALAALLAIGLIFMLVRLNRKNVNVYVRAKDGVEFELVGRRKVSASKPVIDLRGTELPYNEAVIEISGEAVGKLFGKLITIEMKEGSRTHLVEQVGIGSYWFSVNTYEEELQ